MYYERDGRRERARETDRQTVRQTDIKIIDRQTYRQKANLTAVSRTESSRPVLIRAR